MQRYKVEIYNFSEKKYGTMKFVQLWKNKKFANKLSKDEAEFVEDIAVSVSGGSIRTRISKDIN